MLTAKPPWHVLHLKGIAWRQPLTRILVKDSALAQQQACGDGTSLSAFITARLVLDSFVSNCSGPLVRQRKARAWRAANTWISEALGQQAQSCSVAVVSHNPIELCIGVKWNDVGSILAIIRSVVSPKLAASGLSGSEAELLISLLARGFVDAVADDPRAPACVRVLPASGEPVQASCCVKPAEALLCSQSGSRPLDPLWFQQSLSADGKASGFTADCRADPSQALIDQQTDPPTPSLYLPPHIPVSRSFSFPPSFPPFLSANQFPRPLSPLPSPLALSLSAYLSPLRPLPPPFSTRFPPPFFPSHAHRSGATQCDGALAQASGSGAED